MPNTISVATNEKERKAEERWNKYLNSKIYSLITLLVIIIIFVSVLLYEVKI